MYSLLSLLKNAMMAGGHEGQTDPNAKQVKELVPDRLSARGIHLFSIRSNKAVLEPCAFRRATALPGQLIGKFLGDAHFCVEHRNRVVHVVALAESDGHAGHCS